MTANLHLSAFASFIYHAISRANDDANIDESTTVVQFVINCVVTSSVNTRLSVSLCRKQQVNDMDGYGQRFESIAGRENKAHKKKSSNHTSSYYEDGDRKPKFVSLAENFNLTLSMQREFGEILTFVHIDTNRSHCRRMHLEDFCIFLR